MKFGTYTEDLFYKKWKRFNINYKFKFMLLSKYLHIYSVPSIFWKHNPFKGRHYIVDSIQPAGTQRKTLMHTLQCHCHKMPAFNSWQPKNIILLLSNFLYIRTLEIIL